MIYWFSKERKLKKALEEVKDSMGLDITGLISEELEDMGVHNFPIPTVPFFYQDLIIGLKTIKFANPYLRGATQALVKSAAMDILDKMLADVDNKTNLFRPLSALLMSPEAIRHSSHKVSAHLSGDLIRVYITLDIRGAVKHVLKCKSTKGGNHV